MDVLANVVDVHIVIAVASGVVALFGVVAATVAVMYLLRQRKRRKEKLRLGERLKQPA